MGKKQCTVQHTQLLPSESTVWWRETHVGQIVTAPSDKAYPRDMFRGLYKCRGRKNSSFVVLNSHVCKMGKTNPASSDYLSEA